MRYNLLLTIINKQVHSVNYNIVLITSSFYYRTNKCNQYGTRENMEIHTTSFVKNETTAPSSLYQPTAIAKYEMITEQRKSSITIQTTNIHYDAKQETDNNMGKTTTTMFDDLVQNNEEGHSKQIENSVFTTFHPSHLSSHFSEQNSTTPITPLHFSKNAMMQHHTSTSNFPVKVTTKKITPNLRRASTTQFSTKMFKTTAYNTMKSTKKFEPTTYSTMEHSKKMTMPSNTEKFETAAYNTIKPLKPVRKIKPTTLSSTNSFYKLSTMEISL